MFDLSPTRPLSPSRIPFPLQDRDRDGTVWVDDLIASLQHKLPPAEVREAVEEALGPADPGDLGQHQMSFDRFVELVTVKSCDSLESLDIYDDRWGKSRNGTQHGSTHGGSTTAAFDALRALQIAADGSQHGKVCRRCVAFFSSCDLLYLLLFSI